MDDDKLSALLGICSDEFKNRARARYEDRREMSRASELVRQARGLLLGDPVAQRGDVPDRDEV